MSWSVQTTCGPRSATCQTARRYTTTMTVREYLAYAARLRNVPTNDVKRRLSDVSI